MWRRVACAVLACATAAAGHAQPAPDPRLIEVQQLLEAGAADLALRRIELAQTAPDPDDAWAAWERLRFTAYRKTGDYRALLDRLQVVPASVPAASALPLRAHAIDLLLDAGVKADYETLLRSLIWHPAADAAQLGEWRRLVIRAWHLSGRLEDARLAIANYQHEYLPGDPDWLHLRARVLLQSGDASGAAALLSAGASGEGRLLRLLARLRAGVDLPAQVLDETLVMLRALDSNPRVAALGLSVAAEAAERGANHAQRVAALERLFGLDDRRAADALFSNREGDLWEAYLRYAEAIGNSANLLVGAADSWLQYLEKENDGLRRRAAFALLAGRADAMQAGDYHALLLGELQKAGLERTGMRLYQDPQRFPEATAVPASVRYRIVGLAADRGDYALAARMAGGLDTPPPGTIPGLSTLTAARVAVYAGDYDKGAQELRRFIDETPAFDDESADRVLQVIFDLQGAAQHRTALALMESLFPKIPSPQQRRELLFWMADSADAEKRQADAAALYLRSALAAAGGNDLWGHSARFRAAECLSAAGLVDDARAVYAELLRVTVDPMRRTVIQRGLQDLSLKKAPRNLERYER